MNWWVIFYLFFILCTVVDANEDTLTDPILDATVTLREHGYTLGDMVNMHVEFVLDKRYTFDPNSLPLKGPITAWLDLRDIRFAREKMPDDDELIKIELKWQLFGTVAEAQIINMPEILLRTMPVEVVGKEEQQTRLIRIPAKGIYLSPVLPEKLSDEEAPRPIIPPPAFDSTTPLIYALMSFFVATLVITYWLYLQDKLPWLPRNPGAMTRLDRDLRKLGIAKHSELTVDNIRMIHTGLAACAGQSLYPNTLHQLFENAPYLNTEEDTIRQFFNTSWQLFHQQQMPIGMISKDETLAWIRRAALAERVRHH